MNKFDNYKIYLFIILFFILFVGEFLINQITHSVLILVDSYYNLFQICTLIFILIDHKTSQEKSIRATFGWARFSVLGTLIAHTFFGALVFAIIVESLQLLLHTSHEETAVQPHYNLFAAIFSVFLQFLSCGVIMRLLNRDINNQSMRGSKVQMHFVVNSKLNSKGDTKLEHVAISEQQANQMIIKNYNNNKEINQNDEINQTKSKQSLNSSLKDLDGLKMKELKQNKINQQHLTLRIFRNYISCTFLIVNSIIGCILLKSKSVDQEIVNQSLKLLDPLSAIFSVIFLSILVYPEVKQSGLILLQSLPSYIDLNTLKRKLLKKFPMIYELHELHVWSLTTDKIIATCHIKIRNHFKTTEQFKLFFSELELFFKNEGIDLATIQPEFMCDNALKSENSNCTLNDETSVDLQQRLPSCLLKCSTKDECEKSQCCHVKSSSKDENE